MRISVWTYPWDVLDLGADKVVSELQEEAGVNNVSLAVAYHAGRFLQVRSPRRKVYFPEDGTIYFKFDPRPFENLGIMPKASSVLSEGDPLRMTIEECRRHRMKTSAWFVCLHNTRIGQEYRETCVENAFGDYYHYCQCPSKATPRRYVVELLRQLTKSYELDAVELESLNFMGYYHEFHHEKDGLGLTARDQLLLSLCFCPACMKAARAAGVDAQAARKLVINELNRSFERATPVSDTDSFRRSEAEFREQGLKAFDALPDLKAYLEWRRSPVLSLLEEVRDAVLPDTKVFFLGLSAPDPGWLFGVDIGEISKRCEGIIVCCHNSAADRVKTNISETAAILSKNSESTKTSQGENTEIHAGFRIFYPEIGSAQELKNRVSAALEGGANGLVFYNYGLIPKARLGWIKESLG